MKAYKKFGLVFALIIAGFLGALALLDWARPYVPTSELAAVAVPLEDGVWALHPAREPACIYQWQSEDHFAIGNGGNLVLFDGSEVWTYYSDREELRLYSAGQTVDYTLGPAGVLVYWFPSGRAMDIYYLAAGSQRWESVSWSEQPVSVWNLNRVLWGEGASTRDYYYDAAAHSGLPADYDRVLHYAVATREDGLHCIVHDPFHTHTDGERMSDWFELAPTDIVTLDSQQMQYMITRIDGGNCTHETLPLYGSRYRASACATSGPSRKSLRFTAAPVAPSRCGNYVYCTTLGSLYYSDNEKECIDRFAGVSKTEFDAARLYGTTMVFPDGGGSRVYARFGRDLWYKFKLNAAPLPRTD